MTLSTGHNFGLKFNKVFLRSVPSPYVNLLLNTSKTKIMVCSKGKIRNISILQFKYGTYDLHVVFVYVYLGVKLSYNGKFKEHMLYASAKGTKAMIVKGAHTLSKKIEIRPGTKE